MDNIGKSKAQEAAEERALARLGQIESAYQRRSGDPFNTEIDEDAANTPRPNAAADPTATTITVTDTDQQLPRYVP